MLANSICCRFSYSIYCYVVKMDLSEKNYLMSFSLYAERTGVSLDSLAAQYKAKRHFIIKFSHRILETNFG